jgi:uncharacterized membrane protein
MATAGPLREFESMKRKSLAPDLIEKVLAVATTLMLAALLYAVVRGAGTWERMPFLVWLHIATIGTALALTPVLMLRRRGDRWHRRLGWTWCIAMFTTGALSFWIRGINGGLSFIHIFSVMTVIAVPSLVIAARAHQVGAHRRAVRGVIIGGLLIAGLLTFVPSRLLGSWFFS